MNYHAVWDVEGSAERGEYCSVHVAHDVQPHVGECTVSAADHFGVSRQRDFLKICYDPFGWSDLYSADRHGVLGTPVVLYEHGLLPVESGDHGLVYDRQHHSAWFQHPGDSGGPLAPS